MTVNHAVESVAQGESPGGRRVCEGSLQEAEPHVVLWFRRSAKGGGGARLGKNFPPWGGFSPDLTPPALVKCLVAL